MEQYSMRQSIWRLLGTIILCSIISCSGPMELSGDSNNLLTPENETIIINTPSPLASPTSEILSTPSNDKLPESGMVIDPPVGLTFCANGSLIFINKNQQPTPLAPCDSIISPNNQYAAFIDTYLNSDIWAQDLYTGELVNLTRTAESDPEETIYREIGVWSSNGETLYYLESASDGLMDIWAVDVNTGRKRNVSNTPDRDEHQLHYWGKYDSLLFFSHSSDEESGLYNDGYVSLISEKGTDYRILSDRMEYIPPQISPDGQTIALYGGDFYNQKNGINTFTFTTSEGVSPDEIYLGAPAWSNDSHKIAWSVDVLNDTGIGILDLNTNNLRILHRYVAHRGEGFPPVPKWSPDGKWLAFEVVDDTNYETPNSLWVTSADGHEEFNLGDGGNPIWKPDSSQLVFTSYTDGSVMLTDTGIWQPHLIDLPDNSDLLDWNEGGLPADWISDIYLNLEIRDVFVITEAGANLNVRESPSMKDDVLGQLMSGDTFILMDYPAYSDKYKWWKIRTATGLEGWIVEHNGWYRVKEK
jgi:Tol biopolymer transport system component